MSVGSWVFGGFWGFGGGAIHGYATSSVCWNYDLFVDLAPGSVLWLWASYACAPVFASYPLFINVMKNL